MTLGAYERFCQCVLISCRDENSNMKLKGQVQQRGFNSTVLRSMDAFWTTILLRYDTSLRDQS